MSLIGQSHTQLPEADAGMFRNMRNEVHLKVFPLSLFPREGVTFTRVARRPRKAFMSQMRLIARAKTVENHTTHKRELLTTGKTLTVVTDMSVDILGNESFTIAVAKGFRTVRARFFHSHSRPVPSFTRRLGTSRNCERQ